jgi:hypothetical protein
MSKYVRILSYFKDVGWQDWTEPKIELKIVGLLRIIRL